MMEILEAIGIPGLVVSAIGAVYGDTSQTVLSPDGETETFPILATIALPSFTITIVP